MVAQASAEHPRNGGADMVELEDGSIFMSRMLIHASGLKEQAGDDAPSDLITLRSRDGGRTWGEQHTFIEPAPGETARQTIGRRRASGSTGKCWKMLSRCLRLLRRLAS